jgi:hypothetical protein
MSEALSGSLEKGFLNAMKQIINLKTRFFRVIQKWAKEHMHKHLHD